MMIREYFSAFGIAAVAPVPGAEVLQRGTIDRSD
jgi:hypothetical protein